MTQMGQGPYGRKPARSNVFTVLVFVAFVVLAVGVGFVWWKNY
jgi:flagellin-like protein